MDRESKRSASVNRLEISLSDGTRQFLERLVKPLVGETSIAQKLDAIMVMLGDLGGVPSRLALVENRLEIIHGLVAAESTGAEVLTGVNNLDRKVDTMSSNIERIEKEAADAAENVGLVRTALETLNTTVSELKTTVADLQAQVAQGQLDQARLDAAAAALEKADEDMDALVLPPTGGSETPPEGGGTEG